MPILLGPDELETWTRSPSRRFLPPGEGVRVGVRHLWMGGGVVHRVDTFEEPELACIRGYLQEEPYIHFTNIVGNLLKLTFPA